MLSGGDVSVLMPLGEDLEPQTDRKKLFDGIVAYGNGRTAEAKSILLSLDASSFDTSRGAHLSLAQALLASRTNPERAFEYFEGAPPPARHADRRSRLAADCCSCLEDKRQGKVFPRGDSLSQPLSPVGLCGGL